MPYPCQGVFLYWASISNFWIEVKNCLLPISIYNADSNVVIYHMFIHVISYQNTTLYSRLCVRSTRKINTPCTMRIAQFKVELLNEEKTNIWKNSPKRSNYILCWNVKHAQYIVYKLRANILIIIPIGPIKIIISTILFQFSSIYRCIFNKKNDYSAY